jgi:murein DD-endopeptidase MepM/ murein hydrolase activator NlpD
MGRRVASGAVALLFTGSLLTGVRASAQEPPPTTTTTVTTPPTTEPPPDTTTTTVDQGTTTTTVPGTTTTLPAPPDDPAANGDSPSPTVPAVDVTVPPRTGAYANQGSYGQVIRRQLRVARATALQSAAVHDAAVARVRMLEAERARLMTRVDKLRLDEQAAIARLQRAREVLAERAANAYVRGGSSELTLALHASDPNDYYQRVTLMQAVLDADAGAVDEVRAASAALREDLSATADAVTENQRLLADAQKVELVSAQAAQSAQFELAVFAAGSQIVITGFTFPVDDPHEFTDSFGAPRLVGTPDEHFHEGTDILAPQGTKLFAAERGLVTRMDSNELGGITVWLKGESGTYYYYAHLVGYAPDVREGMVVDAGTVLGFVGDTGDARGGPPHCHFEIHPEGGPAVNPYPLLKVVDEMRERAPTT